MANQSLYRRYRPRRFSELRGQEHIVRALRGAVINNREGQAYLFSGPRGTGKTTSARILAKVLNCERPVEGEPCCECDSCLAVERGTSYDVHELDAASNNGVEAIRSIIEKSALGTPGRHRVYILDEVHMLTKGAEAALLKTLEEPPPHVVFVLATTDPQKVSDTIRSRTQHLRFHLLPMDELEAHVRWVAQDAGLEVSDSAIQSVLEQGGGSARDTLSALELVASAGGDEVDAVQYGEFVEALIEHDPGRALTAAAFAVQQGRDPRGLTEDLVRHLRDCFLSLMAPELVALPEGKAAIVADQAARLGAARVVRAMERLGEMLVEMRHAPDPRLLLEVALVQLTHEPAANDMHTLMARLERLEEAAASGVPIVAPGVVPSAAAPVAPKVDPATGRVQLGGGARREPAPGKPPEPAGAVDAVDAAGAVGAVDALGTDRVIEPPAVVVASADVRLDRVGDAGSGAASSSDHPVSSGPPAAPAAAGGPAERASAMWRESVVPALKPFARALFAVAAVSAVREGALVLALPNETHRRKCADQLGDVETTIARLVGERVPVTLIVDGSGASDDHGDSSMHPVRGDRPSARPEVAPVVELHPGGAPTPDEDIDLDDLVDAPPESVITPIERLAQAFPGSELLDERR